LYFGLARTCTPSRLDSIYCSVEPPRSSTTARSETAFSPAKPSIGDDVNGQIQILVTPRRVQFQSEVTVTQLREMYLKTLEFC